jgi:hypothetical protein
MKSSYRKEIEELFYKGQYKVGSVPKHHVMNMKGRRESTFFTILICGGENFVLQLL